MDPRRAVTALSQALDAGEAAVTVADVDWARFAPLFTVRRPSPLITGLPEAAQALAGNGNGDGGGVGHREDATGGQPSLARQLAALPRAEQARVLTDLIRAKTAAALGHPSPDEIGPERAFSDLGFDSLMVVDFRNRLNTATGLSLPITLLYDYPTPAILAGYLRAELLLSDAAGIPLVGELERLESLIPGTAPDDATHELVTARLQRFLAKWASTSVSHESHESRESHAIGQKIESATDDEIFDFIHREFGREAR